MIGKTIEIEAVKKVKGGEVADPMAKYLPEKDRQIYELQHKVFHQEKELTRMRSIGFENMTAGSINVHSLTNSAMGLCHTSTPLKETSPSSKNVVTMAKTKKELKTSRPLIPIPRSAKKMISSGSSGMKLKISSNQIQRPSSSLGQSNSLTRISLNRNLSLYQPLSPPSNIF